ncbi:uncharacterized protein PAC_03040 [Phialocephala subalpina]|uniref:DUF1279 domain-containing protein n=1 Tax=Phialocephala subalpina TaxID=576137 RepID=A0A1L7WK61_9HELO|nr:uncharacterized protein PAC_03040 [Phialocephala subalpina]
MLRTTIYARIAARFPSTLRSNFRPIDIATTSLRSAPRRTFASSKSTSFTFSSNGRPTLRNSTILQRLQNSIRHFRTTRRRYNGAGATATEEPTTLGGRLKKLSREYGWSALGVYLALSALDFPFCYLLVKYLGTERIGDGTIGVEEDVGLHNSVKECRGGVRGQQADRKERPREASVIKSVSNFDQTLLKNLENLNGSVTWG